MKHRGKPNKRKGSVIPRMKFHAGSKHCYLRDLAKYQENRLNRKDIE